MAPERPSTIKMEGLTARAKRGPDQHGHWYWTARWTDEGGQRFEQVVGWMPRPDAVRAAARLLADETRKRVAPPAREIETVGQLLSKWLAQQELRAEAGEIRPGTLHQYRYGCEWGMGYLADVRASALTSDLLHDTMLKLRAKLAPRTVTTIGRIIAIAHGWALERGHIEGGRPVRVRMAAPTVRPKRTPSEAQITDVLSKLTGWKLAYVSVLAATGARPGEIAVLRREHVDVTADGWAVLHIPDEPGCKTGARDVPLQPWAVVALRPLLDIEDDARIFPVNARGMASETIRKMGGKWSLYGLRRAAATTLIETPGVSPGAAAKLLGHSPAIAAALYQDASPSTLRNAMKAAGVGRKRDGKLHHLAVVGDNSGGQDPE